LWGLFPLYWKLLRQVPAWEIIGHRVVWSVVFAAIILTCGAGWEEGWRALRHPRIRLSLMGSSLFIGANWLLYIWAVNAGYVLECSLGYFIAPLVGMLLGVVFLKERLRQWQVVAIGMIAAAVAVLTLQYGRVPWIALTLAVTFGIYSLMRKKINVRAIDGLFIEALALLLPALVYLVWLEAAGRGSFLHASRQQQFLLMLSGVVTALPLLLFMTAVRQLDLTTIGVIQYFSPMCQFLLAVFVYHEPLGTGRLVVFAVIWVAVALYLVEAIWGRGEPRRLRSHQMKREMAK
jgi:chloramphenicol-sensitive protein RarD